MVTANVDVEAVIRAVIDELQPVIPVTAVILFGSYASGNSKRWSDIDVAVISPAFSGVPMWRRQELLAEALPGADVRLSPLGYSPEEFAAAAPHSFLREIIRTGRVVYEAPRQ